MRKQFSVVFFLFAALCPAFADISFINGDLKSAKSRAANEGKLILLDFWASYCTPCKMMDEYTFSDPSVSEYVNANFIPVKVDIQSFDGYDLKNQFNITLLPTFIILNSKGVQVGKHEETMAATRFISTLQNYDSPKNRVKLQRSNSGFNATTGFSNINNAPRMSAPPRIEPSRTRPSEGKTVLTGAQRTEVISGAFTIQASAYFDEEKLGLGIKNLKNQTVGQRIFVSKRRENGRMVYRVLVGRFDSRQAATNQMRKLKINGLVRDFETFK